MNSTGSLLDDASSSAFAAFTFASTILSPMLGPVGTLLSPLNPQAPFHTLWDSMCARYSEYDIFTTGSLLVQILFYFGTAFPGFLFQFIDAMKERKIQAKTHTMAEQWKCIRTVCLSKTFIYLPLIVAMYYVVSYFGVNVPYSYATMPSWYSMIPRMVFCLLVEDTWHYWAHRLLHIKSLYGPIHKLHHTYHIPFGLAAEYAHPVETMALGVGFFLPLPIVCDHLFVFWCWLAVRMVQTTEVHSGFDFPFLNPMYLLPGYGGVRFHDFHHSYFNACYASTFTHWDWLCGTAIPFDLHEKKRKTKAKQAKIDITAKKVE